MFLDIVYIIILLLAVIKGYRRGIIVGVFSFLAFIIGIIAALKFSVVVAGWLQNFSSINSAWVSFLAFIIVLFSVVLLVRIVAKVLHEAVKMLLLGWADKLGGIILYVIIYTLIYSVILFFATYIHLINQDMIDYSKSYSFVEPFGQKIINQIGEWLPLFKDMFKKLGDFFQLKSQIKSTAVAVFYSVYGNIVMF
jgi:membrane protein required for colicin V production